jgi:hypothetical protein
MSPGGKTISSRKRRGSSSSSQDVSSSSAQSGVNSPRSVARQSDSSSSDEDSASSPSTSPKQRPACGQNASDTDSDSASTVSSLTPASMNATLSCRTPSEMFDRCFSWDERREVFIKGNLYRLMNVVHLPHSANDSFLSNMEILVVNKSQAKEWDYFMLSKRSKAQALSLHYQTGGNYRPITNFELIDFAGKIIFFMEISYKNLYCKRTDGTFTFTFPKKITIDSDLLTTLYINCGKEPPPYCNMKSVPWAPVLKLPTLLCAHLDNMRTFHDARVPVVPLDKDFYLLLCKITINCPFKKDEICQAHPVHHNGQARPTFDQNYPLTHLINKDDPAHQTYERFVAARRPGGLSALNSLSREMYNVLMSLPAHGKIIEFFHPITLLVMKLYIDQKRGF